jgi:hypothetical protein
MNLYGPISKEACRISGSIILSEIGTYKSAYGKQFPEQRTSTGARQRSVTSKLQVAETYGDDRGRRNTRVLTGAGE